MRPARVRPPCERERARGLWTLSISFSARAPARVGPRAACMRRGGGLRHVLFVRFGFGLRARRPARSLRLSCPPANRGLRGAGGAGGRGEREVGQKTAGGPARPAVHPQPRLNRGLKITNQNAAQNPRASHTSTDTSTRRQDPSPREHCRAWLRRVALRWQGAAYIYIYITHACGPWAWAEEPQRQGARRAWRARRETRDASI